MPEEVLPVKAERAEQDFNIDRRAWLRYPQDREASCQPFNARSNIFWSGRIQNISTGGLAIVLDRRFEAGTLLSVALQSQGENCSRTLLVRVVHDTLVTAHPGLRWLVGCAFVKDLSEQELEDLLRSAE